MKTVQGARYKVHGHGALVTAKAVFAGFNFDDLVKSRKWSSSVIPAKAGIQCLQSVMNSLDPGFHRGDDFLRIHQF